MIEFISVELDSAHNVFSFLLSVYEQGFWPLVISVHYFEKDITLELGYLMDDDKPKKVSAEGYDQMYHRP